MSESQDWTMKSARTRRLGQRGHRDQSGDGQTGRWCASITSGHGGAADQGGQAGGEEDAVVLLSLSVERSAAGTQSAGLQLEESVAAAGLAQANRDLVADQLAATFGENGWTAGEACPLLLACAGGEPSDEAALWEYGAGDRGAALRKRLGDGSKVRMIVKRVPGMAMREEVYAQAPGASTLQGRSGEQRGCRSSTTPSRASLETKKDCFPRGTVA